MTVASQSLRKHNRAQTGAAIHEAAYCIVKKQGFEATSIDDIAAAAHISRRTFFNYYTSKELALYGLLKPSVSTQAIETYNTSTEPILYRCVQLLLDAYRESIATTSTPQRRREIWEENPNVRLRPHVYITQIEELVEPIMQRVHHTSQDAPTELTRRVAGAVLRYCQQIDPELHETTIRKTITALGAMTKGI